MSSDYCCSNSCCISRPQNVYSNNTISPKIRTIQILDNELRLRAIRNSLDCHHSILNSNSVDRYDELTHFFNLINGLFHQSAFTLGISTYHLASLLHLPEFNVGINMQIDQQNLEQYKLDLNNLTLYSLIGRNELNTVTNSFQQQNQLNGMIKFHTIDRNFMFGINHRWTPSLTTTFRFGRKTQQKQLWSHIEYRCLDGIYELIGEYGTRQQSSGIQFRCLSCLWRRMNLQIDGGIDFKITSKENLADIALRFKRSSDSLVFKCNLYRPIQHYLIGIQRCIQPNFTIGLLMEKHTDHYQHQRIKFSLMSQWYLNTIGLRVNTLVNSQNELCIALTHQFRYFPLVLQAFNSYSWTRQKCKWGIGLQILL
ncbi:hypothetical protein I4U23_010123 [Adineta vaga]|nr:hypothetical protein I4U23_010123 [Adineta vaga]